MSQPDDRDAPPDPPETLLTRVAARLLSEPVDPDDGSANLRLLEAGEKLRAILVQAAAARLREVPQAMVDPEDVASVVLADIHHRPDRYADVGRGPDEMRKFLARCARNAAGSAVKKAYSLKAGEGRVMSLDGTPSRPGPGATTTTDDPTPSRHVANADLLVQAKRLMTPDERRAFELVREQGLTTAEAGARMHRSDAAVRGLLARARERMNQLLPTHDQGA